MGANVMQILANQPLAEQEQQNRNQMTQAQVPLLNAQTTQAQQQAQLVREQMQDNAALTSAWSQSGGDWDKAMQIAKQNGLSYRGYAGAMDDHLRIQHQLLQNTIEQNTALQPMYEEHGQRVDAVLQSTKEGTPERAQAAQQLAQYLNPQSPNAAPFLTDLGLRNALAGNHYLGKSTEDALKIQQAATSAAEQSEAEQRTATAKRTQGLQDLSGVSDADSFNAWRQRNPDLAKELPSMYSPIAVQSKLRGLVPVQEQPGYQIQQNFAQGANQQSRHAQIDSVTSDPDLRKEGYTLADAATKPEELAAAIREVGGKQAQRNFDLDPRMQAYKVQTALATGQGMSGVREKEAAAKELEQSAVAVGEVQATGQTLKNLAAQAAAGNAAADAQIRPMLVEMVNGLQGIKRASGGQMDAPMGSLLDRAQGVLTGLGTGVRTPATILQQIPGLVDTFTDTATRVHQAKVQAVHAFLGYNGPSALPSNGNTPAPSPAVVPPAVKSLLSPSSVSVGVHTLSDNSVWRKAPDGTITPVTPTLAK